LENCLGWTLKLVIEVLPIAVRAREEKFEGIYLNQEIVEWNFSWVERQKNEKGASEVICDVKDKYLFFVGASWSRESSLAKRIFSVPPF
jgi:hypothetical protein